MYRVLARTWRPQSFDELVGQQHISRALTNAIESDRLAHAYIFAGVRGIGKTTVARILAKCLNCEKGPTRTPCNECASCVEITESRSMDVLELDAASRRGIDDVRELQEIVSYKAARGRYRILILDEFHMLTTPAFNALLKTLEEPPPQVIFILATTEIQKILPTILSRCQVFEFRRVAAAEMAKHLRKVCDSEGVKISDHALDRIAWAGEGSVRDSLSVLERVLAFCGTEVGDEDALQVLGAVRHDVLEELVEGLASRDAGRMLTMLDGLVREGYDLVHFWGEMVGALRDLLVLRVDPERTENLSRTPEQGTALLKAAERLSDEDVLRAFQVVADLEVPLRGSGQPRFLFEAALVRLASLGAVRPIEELLSQVTGGASSAKSAPPRPTAPRPQKKKRAEPQAVPEPAGPIVHEPPPRAAPIASSNAPAPEFLAAFLAAVQESKPMLGAILEEAASATLVGNELQIRFGDGSGTIRKRLESKESRSILERLAGEAAGRAIRIRIAEADPGSVSPAAETRSAPSDTEPAGTVREPAPPRPTSEPPGGPDTLLAKATSEPGIKKLLYEFGAEIVEIRPLEGAESAPSDDTGAGPTKESR